MLFLHSINGVSPMCACYRLLSPLASSARDASTRQAVVQLLIVKLVIVTVSFELFTNNFMEIV